MVPMNSKYRVNIPLGLESLLEGLAGAVLREQPVDIYRFAAEYFEKLLASRDEASARPETKRLQTSKPHNMLHACEILRFYRQT
nr:PREDICTED: sperm surface protein Sp17-like [Bemisia tabaci]